MNLTVRRHFGALCAGLIGFYLLVFAGISRSNAAQFNLLHAFAGAPSDGANPEAGALATDGTTFYGLTLNGGATNNTGTLFKMNTNGTSYQILHSFSGLTFIEIILGGGSGNTNDGVNPYGTPLLIGSTLYGMTISGGTNGLGCVFKINTDGSGFALLHSFGSLNDGTSPYGSLVTDGTNLFGMTSSGSDSGTIFVISTNGTGYHILHDFIANGTDGLNPQGSLVLSGGVLYGMTLFGGTANNGTVFRINANGTGYQKIHDFGGIANGASPYGSLIVSDGILYGMSSIGGTNNVGAVFSIDTSGGNFQLLHSFATTELWQPHGDLTLSNATLYGMTDAGGTNGLGFGGVFQVNTDGSGYQFVHIFNHSILSPADGSLPNGSLILLNGQLYGMTQTGGPQNLGTVFSLGGSSSGGGSIGGLKVNILPAGAVSAGAQWQVDSGAFQSSGITLTNLSAGAHTVSFKAITGWTAPSSQVVLVTLGATNTITGTYTTPDTTKPTLQLSTPTAGQRVSNAVFYATGTANDNVGVLEVFYKLNANPWTFAASANHFTNWTTIALNLQPGTNVFSAFAIDASGNVSATNTITFTFVVSSQLTVNINGAGSLKPNLNGQTFAIGKPLKMVAKAAKGSVFVNWTGSITNSNATLTFTMVSNMVLIANFKDITRPVNVILSPTKNQTIASASPVANGKASDNVGVTAVSFQIDGGAWTPANLTGGGNWTTPNLAPMLLSGPNSISAFALDAAGNSSLTNTILFNYVIQPGADWAPGSMNGLEAVVTPATGSPELVSFDLSTFAQTGAPNDNSREDYGAGTYQYLKLRTNTAQLSLTFTNPPGSSNDFGPIALVFTNHYAGYFSNQDSGDTGGFSATVASNFVAASVSGKTLTVGNTGSGNATVKLAGSTFTKTPANNSNTGTSSGNYTFRRYSPISGMFAFSFTDAADAGETAYVQLTFTSATSGFYFIVSFDSGGVLTDASAGPFTLK